VEALLRDDGFDIALAVSALGTVAVFVLGRARVLRIGFGLQQ
jgi:hypothetical protein